MLRKMYLAVLQFLLTLFYCGVEMHKNEVGAIPVVPIDEATSLWEQNASRSAEVMARRAEASAEEWARETQASGDIWHQAVSAPGARTRFLRGAARAGAAKFARKIREVAATRYPQGIAAAVSDYRAGVEPYLQTIAGITLPQRRPRGDPGNIRRVEAVTTALHNKRMAMLGAGGG